MTGSGRRSALAAIVRGPDAPGRLARACLLVAQGEYPDLDVAACIADIDVLGRRVRDLAADGPAAEALHDVLFRHRGFSGDVAAYDAPDNSYLNRVLERRRGLPILLSVVWIEVARAAGIPAVGVAMPGHFIAAVGPGDGATLVDPFEGGIPLSASEALARASAATGQTPAPDWLRRSPPRATVLRVLENLAGSYERRGDLVRLDRVLGDQLGLDETSGRLLARRGVVRAERGRVRPALDDLNAALEHLPPGELHTSVRDRARRLARLVVSEN